MLTNSCQGTQSQYGDCSFLILPVMLGITNIPWSSHTSDEILEDWLSAFDSLLSFYYKRLLSSSGESRSSSISTHCRDCFGSDGSLSTFTTCQSYVRQYICIDLLILHAVPAKIWSFPKVIEMKNISVWSTFMANIANLPNSICSWHLFLLFSFLSLLLLVTLPSCALIWWALGKWNRKITEGLLVNLNFSEAKTCAVKQSQIQKLSPSACTLPSRGLCHFFEAGSILMGKTPKDDVNL